MPLYSIIFIVLWIVIAGLIAYIGNWVGRRLGKQRLSLFSLRPKYTAVFFTILAGMLIAGLTLYTMTKLSSKVQLAFTQMDVLLKDQASLKTKNAEIRKERSRLRLSLLENRRMKVKSDAELRRALLSVTLAEKKAVAAQKKSNELSRDISQQTAELSRTNRRLTEAHAELNRSRIQLAKINLNLQAANRALDKATKQAFLVGRQNLELYATKLHYETRKMVYHSDQEVIRGTIHPSSNVRGIQSDLARLIADGGIAARQHGAAFGIAGPALVMPNKLPDGKSYNQDQLLSLIASQISKSKTDVVVRVVSLINAVEGQQVLVGFDIIPNKLIYRKGDEVASRILDSDRSEAQLLEQLVRTLKTQVRVEALQRGMVPKPNSDDDGATDSVGEVSYDEILSVVQQVRNQDGLVKVVLRAKEDTFAAEPLKIYFQVIQERSTKAL